MAEPIGAPKEWVVSEERTFRGRASWWTPRRVDDLALVCRVEILARDVIPRRLGVEEELVVKARGRPGDLDRFWVRLDQSAAAHRPRRRRWLRGFAFDALNPFNWWS